MLSFLPVLVFPLLMAAAGVRDAISYTIPNWMPLALAGAFLVAAPLAGLGWSAAGLHLAVGFAALFIGMAMFALGWLGGGDAKLFAAAALWFGWPGVVAFVLVTALFGGLFTVLLLMARKYAPPRLIGAWPNELFQQDAAIPYGVAMALGALVVFPGSEIFAAGVGA